MSEIEQIDSEWSAALDDAGLPRDRVRLYIQNDASSTDEAGAVWFRPGDVLVRDSLFPDVGQVTDANHPDHRDLHRVAVWRDVDIAVLGARLRHELEHDSQWDW